MHLCFKTTCACVPKVICCWCNNSACARDQLRSGFAALCSVSSCVPNRLEASLLVQALDEVQSELDALSSGCSAINAALAADRSSSADLLSEADRLQHELAISQKRSTLVHSFFKQYQLSAAEISALQVLKEPLNPLHTKPAYGLCWVADPCSNVLVYCRRQILETPFLMHWRGLAASTEAAAIC